MLIEKVLKRGSCIVLERLGVKFRPAVRLDFVHPANYHHPVAARVFGLVEGRIGGP
jgi:hypothetical protein